MTARYEFRDGSVRSEVNARRLASYHAWLHHPASRRRTDLESWIKPILPIHAALSIVLRVLRGGNGWDRLLQV